MDIVALSDHDSVDGIAEAIESGERLGVHVIPAVEFSAIYADVEVHLLGYGVDYTNRSLQDELIILRENRSRRVVTMVECMRADGIDIQLSRVRELGRGSIGRAHVARALVESGYADDLSDAFARLIGEGAPYFIPKEVLAVERVIDLIGSSGGVAVLAHPWRSDAIGLIPALQAMGIRGVEAFHSEQTDDESAYLVGLAAATGLLVTGGSDWHGDGPRDTMVGSVSYPQEHLRRFLEVLGVAVDAC